MLSNVELISYIKSFKNLSCIKEKIFYVFSKFKLSKLSRVWFRDSRVSTLQKYLPLIQIMIFSVDYILYLIVFNNEIDFYT